MKRVVKIGTTDEIDNFLYLVVILDTIFNTHHLFCSDKSKVHHIQAPTAELKDSISQFYSQRFKAALGLEYKDWEKKRIIELGQVVTTNYPVNPLPQEYWLGIKSVHYGRSYKGGAIESSAEKIVSYSVNYRDQLIYEEEMKALNSPLVPKIVEYRKKMEAEVFSPHKVIMASGEELMFSDQLAFMNWIQSEVRKNTHYSN